MTRFARFNPRQVAVCLVLVLLGWHSVEAQPNRCPSNTIFFCDNPDLANALWSVDNNVSCDPDSCAWVTENFDANSKPVHCSNLAILSGEDPVSDWLEPCLLWELIFGEFAPTAAPTLSEAPTSFPSLSPSSIPSLLPSVEPTSTPSLGPTSAPVVDNGETEREEEPSLSAISDFDSILVTFVFPEMNNRRQLRALSSLSIATRAELYYLTEAHLQNNIPDLDRLRLVVTPYQEVGLNRQIVITEMLQGTIYLTNPTILDSAIVENMLRNAFSGNALANYIQSLQLSSDPVLSRVEDVTFGIPLGIPNTIENPGEGFGDVSMDPEQDDNDSGVDVIWIIVAVCGSLGLLGLLLVTFVYCSRNSGNLREMLGLKANRTGLSSPTSSMEPQLIRRMQSVDMPSPTGERPENDELPEGTQGDNVMFNDMASEITSVYSYLDRTGVNESMMTDDHSYSIAPSLLGKANPSEDTRDSLAIADLAVENSMSGMWSLTDGLVKSPQKASTNEVSDDIYIFNDDEGISLGSDPSELLVTSPRASNADSSPEKNTSPRSSFEEGSQIQSLVSRNSTFDSIFQSLEVEETQAKPVAEKAKASIVSVLRPNQDLSEVVEVSEASHSISRMSMDGQHSVPSSAVKNTSAPSSTQEAAKAESMDDDDSSLFMGPDSLTKENRQTNSKLLALGEENKVGPSQEKDSYRIAPLFQRLSDKDKEQMGIRRVASRDDSSVGDSIVYPGSYAIADFRDDMSISTAGSRSRRHSVSTKASF